MYVQVQLQCKDICIHTTQLQEPVVLETSENTVLLHRNKITGEVCQFPLMQLD